MFATIKFSISFMISFFILSLPINDKFIFSYINDSFSPYLSGVHSIWNMGVEHSNDVINFLRDIKDSSEDRLYEDTLNVKRSGSQVSKKAAINQEESLDHINEIDKKRLDQLIQNEN